MCYCPAGYNQKSFIAAVELEQKLTALVCLSGIMKCVYKLVRLKYSQMH